MTTEEAIELIENDLKLYSKDLSSKYKNGLRMAISALEKQIPKKPIKSDGEIRYCEVWKCPKCGFECCEYSTKCREESRGKQESEKSK